MFFYDPVHFDIRYFLFIAPAVLLAMWAQLRIRVTYAQAQQLPAPLSGAAAARHILDSAGLNNVQIEEIPGQLSDHFDPRENVLRLSQAVYESRTLAAVGIAAHEAGHAIQYGQQYSLMLVRNAAVPAAGIGSQASLGLMILGMICHMNMLMIWLGIALFSCVVFFQLVNLPVEFNASSRAKAQLVSLGIINQEELTYVSKVLNAAALTYVAATLQAVLTLLYYVMRFSGDRNRD
jgi:Zn-dependent membrane protease YugP